MAFLKYIKFILAFTLIQFPSPTEEYGALESMLKFLIDGQSHEDSEPPDMTVLRSNYDFIVVGAGTAGCVLANRLSEVSGWNVLLLEAGGPESFIMDIPILTTLLQFTSANWNYRTEPQPTGCLGMQDGRCHWPRGKVMGGSSVLNHMIHTRGNRRDYDRWGELGNKGWSYKDVLPYFMKSEDMLVEELAKNDRYHSTGGYLSVTYPPWHTKLAETFLAAGVELGHNIVDYNGQNQTGFSYLQTNQRNGTRISSSRAFLHPVSTRGNLHVKKNSHVTRILIDPHTKRVYGVEFQHRNQLRVVLANKEVVLAAGAINSPQILMLSGIGPKKHLRKHGIRSLVNLKVGYNLQDHIALGGLTFIVNNSLSLVGNRIVDNSDNLFEYLNNRRGPLTDPAGCDALAFVDTTRPNATDGYADLELLFLGGSYASMKLYKDAFAISDSVYNEVYAPIKDQDTWMVFPMLMLPKSKGRIMLRSSNPLHKPLLYPNYLSHPDDVEIILKGVRIAQRLSDSDAFKAYGSRLHDIPVPGCKELQFASDEYWRCAIKQLTQTIYHQSGTCKMGPSTDKEAVVNPKLRVYGVKGLRVADASIMPFVPSAHTNAPTVMIAEKASDMIKKDWGQR